MFWAQSRSHHKTPVVHKIIAVVLVDLYLTICCFSYKRQHTCKNSQRRRKHSKCGNYTKFSETEEKVRLTFRASFAKKNLAEEKVVVYRLIYSHFLWFEAFHCFRFLSQNSTENMSRCESMNSKCLYLKSIHSLDGMHTLRCACVCRLPNGCLFTDKHAVYVQTQRTLNYYWESESHRRQWHAW